MNLDELERLARAATPNAFHNAVLTESKSNSDFCAACSPERILALVRVVRAVRAYEGVIIDSLLKDALRALEETP